MRRLLTPVLAISLLAVVALAATALPATAPAAAQVVPDRIDLPDGWLPEGIVVARDTLYSGSRATGGIVAIDTRTGERDLLVESSDAGTAIGLATDRAGDLLFVAGGGSGMATVYDTDTGDVVASYQLTDAEATFVNDVIVTPDAAWFTDSVNQVLYRVDLGPDGEPGAATTVPLSGDLVYTDGFNANGIEATPSGDALIVVQSNTGSLFAVDPDTGVADEIDLGGEAVTNGDGLLLRGSTLYVVENNDQLVTAVRLAPDLASGTITSRTTDPGFDVPTTLARRGGTLFAVNARFSTPPTPETEYWITTLRLPLR